jgi:hypothetical protein
MSQRKQLVVLAVLVVVAGSIWYWFFFREKTPASTSAVAVAENIPLIEVQNPELHKDRVDRARKTEYKSNGRNIFSSIPPPPQEGLHPIPKSNTPVVPVIPEAPKVSPLTVKFFGYGTVPAGSARRAFFTNGEDVYIVSEGEVLLNRFRILKVNNTNLDYEEISSGLRGTANLEEQGAPPSATQ